MVMLRSARRGADRVDLIKVQHATDLGMAMERAEIRQPVEQAPAYVFLASPESSFVVGEVINVNGGANVP